MKYQQLAKEMTQNGRHHYKQVWRDENAAVYEQYGMSGLFLGHEVIVIKKQSPTHIFGKDYPAKELYPCSEGWGTFAWSVDRDRDKAVVRAKELSERCQKGEFKGRFCGLDRSRERHLEGGALS